MAVNDRIREALKNLRGEWVDHLTTLKSMVEKQQDHGLDKHNPHDDRKEHVGLPDVENYPLAEPEDLIDATRSDLYVTPKRVNIFWDHNSVDQAVSTKVRTPVPVKPLTGDTEIPRQPELLASPFAFNPSTQSSHDHREYEIDVAGGDFTNPVWSHQKSDDLIVSVPVMLDHTTTYLWRCRDVAVDGETSDWSEAQSFTTEVYNLLPLEILSPGNATGVERGSKITWTDTSVSDPEGNYQFELYVLELSDDPTFATVLKTVETGTSEHTLTDDMPWETPLYARVTARWRDTAERSPWSSVVEFTIGAYTLNPIQIVNPVDGGRFSMLSGVEVEPKSVADPESLYTFERYVLEISTDPLFSVLTARVNSASHEISLTGYTLNNETTYYMRARTEWAEADAVATWSNVVQAQLFATDENFMLSLFQGRDVDIAAVQYDPTEENFYVLAAGDLSSFGPDRYLWLVKFTKDGSFAWAKAWGFSGHYLTYNPVLGGNIFVFEEVGGEPCVSFPIAQTELWIKTVKVSDGTEIQRDGTWTFRGRNDGQFRELTGFRKYPGQDFYIVAVKYTRPSFNYPQACCLTFKPDIDSHRTKGTRYYSSDHAYGLLCDQDDHPRQLTSLDFLYLSGQLRTGDTRIQTLRGYLQDPGRVDGFEGFNKPTGIVWTGSHLLVSCQAGYIAKLRWNGGGVNEWVLSEIYKVNRSGFSTYPVHTLRVIGDSVYIVGGNRGNTLPGSGFWATQAMYITKLNKTTLEIERTVALRDGGRHFVYGPVSAGDRGLLIGLGKGGILQIDPSLPTGSLPYHPNYGLVEVTSPTLSQTVLGRLTLGGLTGVVTYTYIPSAGEGDQVNVTYSSGVRRSDF